MSCACSDPCGAGATCTDTSEGPTCTCPCGFAGATCLEEVRKLSVICDMVNHVGQMGTRIGQLEKARICNLRIAGSSFTARGEFLVWAFSNAFAPNF